MNLKAWEATIEQIVAEANHQSKRSSVQRILTKWRAKLEKEPTSLRPYQIDQIVREVRTRLTGVSH